MESKFEFTKSQLIKAFQMYNTEFIESPDSFGTLDDIDTSVEVAEAQADKLLSFLLRV